MASDDSTPLPALPTDQPPLPSSPPPQPIEKSSDASISALFISKKKIKSQIERWQKVNQQTPSSASNLTFDTRPLPQTISDTFIKAESSKFSATLYNEPLPLPVAPPLHHECLSAQHFSNFTELTCTLCQRKFANKGLLEKHATLSELHQTNLKSYLQSMVDTNQETELPQNDSMAHQVVKKVKYKNRAEERRKLTNEIMTNFALPEPKYLVSEETAKTLSEQHQNLPLPPELGQQTEENEREDYYDSDEEVYRMANANHADKFQHALQMTKSRFKSLDSSSSDKVKEVVFKSETGMKLLMKMGWKEGQGLGKDAAGLKVPILPEAMQKGKGLGAHK
jgi:G-patch domain